MEDFIKNEIKLQKSNKDKMNKVAIDKELHNIIWLNQEKDTMNTNGTKKKDCSSCITSHGSKLAWFLCFLSCALSAFFLLLYSVEWGSEKSERWLTAFFLSFLQSMLVIDPVKVRLLATNILKLLVKDITFASADQYCVAKCHLQTSDISVISLTVYGALCYKHRCLSPMAQMHYHSSKQ